MRNSGSAGPNPMLFHSAGISMRGAFGRRFGSKKMSGMSANASAPSEIVREQ
jgi:hypothetical protein